MKDRLFVISQYVLPHHLISRLAGCLAECRLPWVKNTFIKWFVRHFQVDMREAQIEEPTAYEHFNAFFTRALKDGARPLDSTPGAILNPCDGAISQLGKIEQGRIFQAKGHSFSAMELLGGDHERAAPFMGGAFATVYLSPKDYHRVHMPVSGTLRRWSMCRAGSSRSTPSRRRACQSCSRATSGSSACSTPSTAPWRWFWWAR